MDHAVKMCYAAILFTLHDDFGIETDRCVGVLNGVDRHMLFSFTSLEAIEQVYERMSVMLDFNEVLEDRVSVKGVEGA